MYFLQKVVAESGFMWLNVVLKGGKKYSRQGCV